MREERILDSLKNAVDQAPIDILDKIKQEPRTKMLKHDDITRQDTKTFPFKKLMSYASVAAVFLFILFGWQFQTRMPDSHVYLDVNPSIEMVTNRQDKIIDLKADNIDGEKLIDDLEYGGKTIYQVTGEILDRMMDESYLNKDHEFLLLSVYNKNQDKAEQQKQDLDRRIHEHLQAKEMQPIVLSQKLDNTSTIEKYAREYGISVSRMTFIRNLIILNPELQTEDLVDLSIEELVRLSQGMGLELEKIIDSTDLDKIQALPEPKPVETPEPKPVETPEPKPVETSEPKPAVTSEPKPEETPKPKPTVTPQKPDDDDDDDDDDTTHQQPSIISSAQARSIALSIANGTITDFEFDDDDMEYEVEIELGDLEYEITIDARTGEVIDVEIDD